MAKTIQYVNKYWVRFKNWVCLRKKEAYNNKWNIIYFGAVVFEWSSNFQNSIFEKITVTVAEVPLI